MIAGDGIGLPRCSSKNRLTCPPTCRIGHVRVQVEPIDALHLQPDMTIEHLVDVHHRGHHPSVRPPPSRRPPTRPRRREGAGGRACPPPANGHARWFVGVGVGVQAVGSLREAARGLLRAAGQLTVEGCCSIEHPSQRSTRRQPRRSPRLRMRPLPQRPHRLDTHTNTDELTGMPISGGRAGPPPGPLPGDAAQRGGHRGPLSPRWGDGRGGEHQRCARWSCRAGDRLRGSSLLERVRPSAAGERAGQVVPGGAPRQPDPVTGDHREDRQPVPPRREGVRRDQPDPAAGVEEAGSQPLG